MNLDDQIKAATERGKQLLGPDAVAKAVAAEREACAKLAEEWRWRGTEVDVIGWHPPAAESIAKRIRARGEKPQ